eukprot:CAMPEP_0119300612 /NCGR_PEP_ID=MMETSP1333-20130426/2532_1 /TAXON_ID=418940 /ORGANISM="Scyphosphaera apsteinii, Strain RCC1455" /LENGTH=440 /DNA_ID=CAMNT_0007302443 /DNA_START=27 /DNA_END=1349 /DNA_ORIENTATION=+
MSRAKDTGTHGPRTIVGGIASGVGAVVGGVVGGGAALIAAPVVGAKKDGIKGAMAGTVAGIAGLTLGVVGGVAIGVKSIVTGTINTPGTIKALITNDDLYGKETIDLSAVSAETEQEVDRYSKAQQMVMDAAADTNEAYVPTANVKESHYYEVLGVQSDVSAANLKKSFYKLAMKQHPDKGGDVQQFQSITEAYEVLSDNTKRKKYDEGGKAALQDHTPTDPSVVFAMMFGDSKFDHLIGELGMVQAMRLDEGMEEKSRAASLRKLQAEREEHLAKLIAVRLDAWTNGEREAFIAAALDEYSELTQTNLGPQMLMSIGIMYELTADRALGVRAQLAIIGIGGLDTHGFKTKARALQAAAQLQKQSKEPVAAEDEAGKRAAKAREMQLTLFNVLALDIESTVGRAAMLALQDTSITKEKRHDRARGLLKLGRIFQGQFSPK